MNQRLLRLRQDLGATGVAAIALLAAFTAFSIFAVQPLEERNALLRQRVSRHAGPQGPDTAAEKVAAVYRFLQKDEETTDWLAKLHGIGAATGVQLNSASYRTEHTAGRIVRYEILLPVSGSYPQIRDFLRRALAEIPVLSLDQLALKRDGRSGGALEAQLRLTLHMVRS